MRQWAFASSSAETSNGKDDLARHRASDGFSDGPDRNVL